MRIGFTFCRSVLSLGLFSALFSVLLSSSDSGLRASFVSAARANEPSSFSPLDASVILDSWPMFTSDVGRFKVAMPSAPAAYTFSSDLDATDSLMYMQMQLTDATHLEIYAAAFIAVPEVNEHTDIESILLSCVTSLSSADLQSVPQAIALGDYQGVEAMFHDERGLSQVSRCYFAGDRTYLLTASSEPFDAGSGLMPLLNVETMRETNEPVPPQSTESSSDLDESDKLSPGMEAFFRSFEILELENPDA